MRNNNIESLRIEWQYLKYVLGISAALWIDWKCVYTCGRWCARRTGNRKVVFFNHSRIYLLWRGILMPDCQTGIVTRALSSLIPQPFVLRSFSHFLIAFCRFDNKPPWRINNEMDDKQKGDIGADYRRVGRRMNTKIWNNSENTKLQTRKRRGKDQGGGPIHKNDRKRNATVVLFFTLCSTPMKAHHHLVLSSKGSSKVELYSANVCPLLKSIFYPSKRNAKQVGAYWSMVSHYKSTSNRTNKDNNNWCIAKRRNRFGFRMYRRARVQSINGMAAIQAGPIPAENANKKRNRHWYWERKMGRT